jgi:hypothetical protein
MPAAKPAPSTKPLLQKLLVKPAMTVAVLNGPKDVSALVGEVPDGVTVVHELPKKPDAVLVFVRNKAEVDAQIPPIAKQITDKTLLWCAYPKKTSKMKTDITRDTGWDAATAAGLQIVAQVAVDETWAASRFRFKA